MNTEELALEVDERIRLLEPNGAPARLFGIQLDREHVSLVPLWSGLARELPPSLCPPAGLRAIALHTRGWAAPMDEGPPSEHPLRRRIEHTVLIEGEDTDVSVLRYEGEAPQVLRGAVGLVFDLLVACWARRVDPRGRA